MSFNSLIKNVIITSRTNNRRHVEIVRWQAEEITNEDVIKWKSKIKLFTALI
jgi:hypothetical protein